MSKELKILLITLSGIAFVSLIIYTVYLFLGKEGNLLVNKISSVQSYAEVEEAIFEEEFDDNIDRIKINANAANIEIKESNDSDIKVTIYSEGNKNNAYVKNNELIIKAKIKKCRFFCLNQKISKVVVLIPSDYDKEVVIKNKFGNTTIDSFDYLVLNESLDAGDIKIDKVKEADITNHLGDLKITDSIEKLKATLDYGSVKVKEVDSISLVNHLGNIEIDSVNNKMNITNDCGDIKIDSINIKENSIINNNMGDIEIKETNSIRIASEVSLGDNKVKNSNEKSRIVLRVNNTLGDIIINN